MSPRFLTMCLAGLLGLSLWIPANADEKRVAEESSEGDAADVTLTAGTWKDVEGLIKQQQGKIVVVDIWSTSCLPCMTEFPHLVAMQRAHKEHLVCVSFNVDYVGIRNKP